jgi:hypothetical protein
MHVQLCSEFTVLVDVHNGLMGQEKTKVFKVFNKDPLFLEWFSKQFRMIPISSRYMILCTTLCNFSVYLLN